MKSQYKLSKFEFTIIFILPLIMFLIGITLFDFFVKEYIQEKELELKDVHYNSGFSLHAIVMYCIIVTGTYVSTVFDKKKKLKLQKEKS